MKRLDVFSIETISDTDSHLLRDGKDVQVTLPGKVLEKQYQLKDGSFLILTTDDCPYEEVLHILLFTQNLKLLDRIDVGQEYQSAVLENVKIIDPETLAFDFINGYNFRLVLLSERKRFFKKSFFESFIHYKNKLKKKCMIVEIKKTERGES